MLFSRECFLCHYGGQLNTAVEQEAGEKIDCKRQWQSEKENKSLKIQSFCPVFNCSNHADGEKIKSNYCFPSVVK